jgi:anti-anti-sigma factor
MIPFTSKSRKVGDITVILACGELDIATRGTVISATTPWLAPRAHVVLDCSGITFMDSWGLQALLDLRCLAAAADATFALAAVPHSVSRIIKLAGVEHDFTRQAQRPA